MPPPNNFAKVDDVLWRGARPTTEQAAWLVQAGVRSVIDLELFEEDRFSWATATFHVEYRHLPDWEPLATFDPAREDEHLKAFLATLRQLPKPCYTHCKNGQNRTGLAVAAYRLIEKRDPLDAVLSDMESYKGLWAVPDAAYVRSLASRVAEFAGAGGDLRR